VNGEVLQTVKLEGNPGLVATMAGKEVRRSTEVEKIVDTLHGALQESEVENDSREENESSEEPNNKSDERRISGQWEVLGSG
jgi:spore cortex formation protein SpoVR/YcgB (stage V sporulation)